MSDDTIIFKIHINVIATHQVKHSDGTVNMILFDGYCDSLQFHGKILPGGVDTQYISDNGQTTLSARYILEGQDCDNKNCKIFIENTAQSDSRHITTTTPIIRTDSPALKWLESADIYGEIANENGSLVIIIKERITS